MNIVSIICLLIVVASFFGKRKYLLYAAFGFLAFGTTAILPSAMTGGATLLMGSAAFLLLCLKVLIERNGLSNFMRSAFSLKYMGLLTIYTFIAVISAFILPKVFLGRVYIFPVRMTWAANIPDILRPTNANFTQSTYVFIDFLTAVVFSNLVRSRNFLKDYGWALIVGAGVTVATGLLDMATSATGTGALLEMFRTASYAIMTESEVSGVRRVVGLMPEASAFGGLSIQFLAILLFARYMFPPALRYKVVLPVALVLAVLVCLSTSSAAYAGLMAIVGVYFLDSIRRLAAGAGDQKRQQVGEFVLILLVSFVGVMVVLSFEQGRETAFNVIDQMIFKKASSGSAMERASWNTQALTAFVQTMGMGVGVGSVRTSNLFVNILASTGAIGFFFFISFLIKVMFARCKVRDVRIIEMVHGAKLAIIPGFVVQYLAGSVPDYSVLVAALFGVIVGGASMVRGNPQPAGRKLATRPIDPAPARELSPENESEVLGSLRDEDMHASILGKLSSIIKRPPRY